MARGEGHEKHRPESEIVERNLTNKFVWGEKQRRENPGKVQDGEHLWVLASLMDTERTRSPWRESSDRDKPPSWRRLVQTVARRT